MTAPAIRVEGLGKRYRLAHGQERAKYRTLRESLTDFVKSPLRKRGTVEEFWALNDVSFEVQPGEVVGIIGRNGAGKSTLLKMLSRITKPTTGRVEINGRVGSLLEVGTGFHPELTGRENIYLNGSILGMSRQEISKKFDEIVAFAEVEKFLDTPVKRYSSGMYVRLAFAVAAHLEPEILIVDEVLAVGDMQFQDKCLGKIQEVSKGGRTVLFVSHNTQAISRLTTRCLYLKAGVKLADGATNEIMALYNRRAERIGVYNAQTSGEAECRILRALARTSESEGRHVWGRSIEFEFDIEVNAPSSSICFAFQVINNSRNPICHFSSFNPGQGWGTQAGVYRLRCSVPRLRLFMGEFTLATYLADRSTNRMIETLADICNFQVVMGNHHREQYDWQRGDCEYLEDHDWHLVDRV